jgi:excisionase family DNA binding protein
MSEKVHSIVALPAQAPLTTTTSTPRRMLRVKEAAAVYGIGESTLWEWAKKGRIKPVRMGRRLTLFPVDQLEALFSSPTA